MRIVLAGSVSFSERTLAALVRHGANVVGVLGLAESASENVSDYARLDTIARDAGIAYADFVKINDAAVVEQVRAWKPDLMFVTGLSQLVRDELMSIPPKGSIGFHPTRLPKGRGRAPVAWLTYDGDDGAATFFVLEGEADAGAIFVQEPFAVAKDAYAMDVIESVRDAIDRALDRWLPSLLAGEWNPKPQDESQASWYGKRAPEDGLIDWRLPAAEIHRLVRAASRPYPGAFTHLRDRKMIVWRARLADVPFRGVIARILHVENGSLLVQTGDGLMWIDEYEFVDGAQAPKLLIGAKFQ